MSKDQIKKAIGIFSATAVLMAMIIPVSVLASIAQAFPDVPGSTIRLLTSLPSLLGILSNFVISKQAHRIYKRQSMIACTILYIVAGVAPYFFHSSIWFLLVSAALTGFALGGIQNGLLAQICDYFEGNARAQMMGLLSLFVGIGGTVYTVVAANLGAMYWHRAYLAYLLITPLLILQLIFLPSGVLEEKPTKTNRIKVSREVIWICVFGFAMYTFNQLFNANISMLVTARSLGGTTESGMASMINTIGGMCSGLLIIPLIKVFKKYSMAATFVLAAAGCALMALGTSLPMLCVGGLLMAVSYGLFTPLENQYTSESSEAMGLAFNMALVSGVSSFGQVLSPYTTTSITVPFGGSITAKFIVGVFAMIVFAVLTAVYYGRKNASSK